jgi:hypothetical protein
MKHGKTNVKNDSESMWEGGVMGTFKNYTETNYDVSINMSISGSDRY